MVSNTCAYTHVHIDDTISNNDNGNDSNNYSDNDNNIYDYNHKK